MSDLERDVPPAGEDIHLPPGSAQPLILTIGITVALLGLTTAWYVLAAGLLTMAWVLVVWIREARQEFRELPADHGHH